MVMYRVRTTYVDRDGTRRSPGETMNISKERGDQLVARRLVESMERQRPVETATQRPPEVAATRVQAPQHIGGGVYELPNGERVRGREEAEKRMNG